MNASYTTELVVELATISRVLDIMRMDEEEDDLCTPHKLFNLFSHGPAKLE